MLAPACWLHPSGIVGHLPVPTGAAPDLLRASPFPALLPTWQETFSFDFSVNATTEESLASPLIHGPFLLKEIGFRSGSAGGASQLLLLGIGNMSPAPQTLLATPAGLPNRLASDSARTVASYYLTNIFERHALHQEVRQGCCRLIWTLNNLTGAAVTVVGHVTIQHCAELAAPPPLPSS